MNSVCLSADARWVLSGSADGVLCLWELDWDYEAHEPADWDEEARPYLVNFVSLHTRTWTENAFEQLLDTLACAGYGFLRPEDSVVNLSARQRMRRESGMNKKPPGAKPKNRRAGKSVNRPPTACS